MKILAVIETLGYGGAERLLVTTLSELVRRGYKCDVAVLMPPMHLQFEMKTWGIKVYPLNLKHRWFFPTALYKLAKLIRKNKYDIVHGHLYFATLYLRLLSLLGIAPPVVSSLHNLGYDSYPAKTVFKKIRKWLDGYTARKFDTVTVAVSKAVAEHFRNHLRLTNIKVVSNCVSVHGLGIDETIDMRKIREGLGISQDSFLIACVGHFVEEKGHKFLIEALNILHEKHNITPKVLLVGKGPLLNELEQQIKRHNLNDYVLIKDYVTHEILMRLMRSVDLYVQPSTHEGFPIVVTEAMALEKPVIASAVGGLAELIENHISGVLFRPMDTDALAEAIYTIMKDSNKRIYLGHNAMVRIREKFSVEEVCNQWEKLYRECISGDNNCK